MKTLATLGFPSSRRRDNRFECLPQRRYLVTVRDSDSDAVESFVFTDVRAVRITHDLACTEEMVLAYDKLVEIEHSQWLQDVQKSIEAAKQESTGFRHLRIYLDDGPCYEFLCRGGEHLKNA